MQYSNTSREFQIETLKADIKSVVLEKSELEKRNESKIEAYLAFLEHQDSNAGMKKMTFRTHAPQKTQFSIATHVEEMKPVVMEKNEFENRALSKLLACWHSWSIKIAAQGVEN